MDYLLTFIVALSCCYLALTVLYPIAVKVNLLDSPDDRKAHTGNIPLIGGIAMFLGFLVSFCLFSSELNQTLGILIASSIIVGVGVLDDRKNVSIRFRFFMQIMSVMVMISFSDLYVSDLGDLLGTGTFPLGVWAVPITVVAAVGVMNAMNLIDGIDGLAGMSALICFMAVIGMQYLAGHIELIPLLFVAVLIPFLLFNLRAVNKVFMGDAGSMFLGLGVIWVLIQSCQGENPVMNTVTCLWLFSVPVIDTVAIMIRRTMKGQSPFMPDRGHLHHLFLRAGFSHRETLCIMSLVSILFATVGILGDIYQVPEWLMFTGFLLVFVTYLWGINRAWVLLRLVRRQLSKRFSTL